VSEGDATGGPMPLPALREELKLFPGPREEDGSPTWTLYDPARHSFFRIGWAEFEMLSRWQAGDADTLLERVNVETPLTVDASHLSQLLLFLSASELLQVAGEAGCARLDEKARRARKGLGRWLLHNYLYFRIPLVRPDRFLSATLPYVSFFFRREFFLATFAAGLTGLFLVARQWDEFRATFLHFFSLSGLFFYGLALLAAKVGHELGHAYTARRYGVRVPTMGIAFLVLWPLLYTDTTDAWKLPSYRQRRAIVLAGMAVEVMLSCYATLLWSFLPDGAARSAAFLLGTATWVTSLLFNLNPFMRFDGYYMLSDTVRISNLQPRAFALARWWLRRALFGLDVPPPEEFPAARRRWLIAYAFSTWLYRLVLYAGIALLVYMLFFKALGIFLFMVEIGWFIVRPVWQEVRAWWEMHESMEWNEHTRVTLLVSLALSGMLIFPWRNTIDAPAVLKAAAHAAIYPRVPGRIAEVRVHNGDTVRAGDVMFVLTSPELAWQLRRAKLQLDSVELRLRRRGADPDMLSRSLVLQEQYAKALVVYRGALSRHVKLTVRAPMDGMVTDMADGLLPGRWLNIRKRLALLIAPGGATIEAYLPEGAIAGIRSGAAAHFYADRAMMPPLEGMLEGMDRTDTQILEEPYLASVYGGALPVTRDTRHRLIVHGGFYRMRIRPVLRHAPPSVVRGEVRITGEAESMLGRLWRAIVSVLIRESGF